MERFGKVKVERRNMCRKTLKNAKYLRRAPTFYNSKISLGSFCERIRLSVRRVLIEKHIPTLRRKRQGKTLKAGILSTVLVMTVLMLLMVMAVIALWGADFLLFSRANYLRVQRANIGSTFTLYCNYPEQDSVVLLYDSVPGAQMKLRRRPWGLYEVLTVESKDGRVWRAGVLGRRSAMNDGGILWYRNNHGAVTMAGESRIGGRGHPPAKTYGQMQTAFFKGEKLPPENIRASTDTLPGPTAEAARIIGELFKLQAMDAMPDSLASSFRGGGQVVVEAGDTGYLAGAVSVVGKYVEIEAGARLHDIIVVADNITVEDGFIGSVQLFARDSVTVGKNVIMELPSGIYSGKYAELGENSEIDGYMIVDYKGEEDIMKPNCRKTSSSKLRGLFYCSGVAELQGEIAGCAVMYKSVYYSKRGYYSDFLYDITIEENPEAVYPFWLNTPQERRVAKWVY